MSLTGAFRIVSSKPAFDEGQGVLDLELESTYDVTGTKQFEVTVVCDLATTASL